MPTPSIAPATVNMSMPQAFPEGAQLFRFTRDGEFGGRMFRSGELAVVDGAPGEGDAVVLVALGPGRPRLGRVVGTQLRGDRGEPCHLSRWEVAGRLQGVVRPVGTGWAVELFDAPGVVGMAVPTPAPRAAVSEPPLQLSLFAA